VVQFLVTSEKLLCTHERMRVSKANNSFIVKIVLTWHIPFERVLGASPTQRSHRLYL
jgi:hypothetical protein